MTNVILPDLNVTGTEIVADNIRATGSIYASAMLEQMKIFEVVDCIVAAFQNGRLPVRKGSARGLYQYWRDTSQRLTEGDRQSLYARVIGIPGGDEGVVSNRDFNDLWLRFLSSVSNLVRQNLTDLEARTAAQEEARTAGRELARNLSLHGQGVALFAATELQKQIDQIVKLLSDSEIQQAYGTRDIWQLVDQVATLELGGARDSARYRTLASSGASIVGWLAKNARKLSSTTPKLLIEPKRLKVGKPYSKSMEVPKSPSDSDLVTACEKWLSVSTAATGE